MLRGDAPPVAGTGASALLGGGAMPAAVVLRGGRS